MTPADLAADRTIISSATAGPWTADYIDVKDVRAYYSGFNHRMASASNKNNAAFIAASRTRWPAALDEIECLTRQLCDEQLRVAKLQTAIDMAFFRRGCLPELVRAQTESIIEPLASVFEELGLEVGASILPKEWSP